MQWPYGGLICILLYGVVEGSPEPPGDGVLLMTDNTPIYTTDITFILLT